MHKGGAGGDSIRASEENQMFYRPHAWLKMEVWSA
jgi:hypothetical protein